MNLKQGGASPGHGEGQSVTLSCPRAVRSQGVEGCAGIEIPAEMEFRGARRQAVRKFSVVDLREDAGVEQGDSKDCTHRHPRWSSL